MPEENENREQQAAPKKSKSKLIIIIAVALILIIVVLVVVFLFVLGPKEEKAAEGQAVAQSQMQAPAQAPAPAPVQQPQMAPMPSMDMSVGMNNSEIGQIYPIPTLNVNLADPTGITYLSITLALEFDPKNSDLYAEIEAKMPRVLDMIITVLSSKAYEEISTSQGKVNLRNEFLRRINGMMAKGKLYNVYITSFVVQKS